MEQITQPALASQSGPVSAPLTAAQVYEKLGVLLREAPAAANQPLFLVGNDFSFHAWEMMVGKDSTNGDVIWLGTDVPE